MGEFVDKARQVSEEAQVARKRRVDNVALKLLGDISQKMVAEAARNNDQAVITRRAYASEERFVQDAMVEAASRLRLEDPDLHVVHHSSWARCGLSTAPHYLGIGWNGNSEQIITLDNGLELVSRLPKS